MERINRHIMCIDLKSFFASCECIERGLDYFKTPLAVADISHGDGAITLAVTPYLKKFGVKSRGRVFEIPKNIKVIYAKPRMNLYLKMSQQVIGVYLQFVSKEDMHVYSIDEAFLDVTDYLNLYKMTDYELAKHIMQTVYEKTGLCATAGIGPNMLLAKIAMDIEAKKLPDFISKWTYDDVQTKLWNISPLHEMWGIGPRMERNLNNMGIMSVKDLALYDVNKLQKKFGIMGEELWLHANGIDNSLIKDANNVLVKEKSYGHSQILFKDYYRHNIPIIIEEMVEVVVNRLKKNNTLCSIVGFGIGYSRNIGGGFYHQCRLGGGTDSRKQILDLCMAIFEKYYDDLPIRKVSISLGRITPKEAVQLNLFEEAASYEKDDIINKTILELKDKFGANSLLKASNLLKDSTMKERNKKVGGHSA